MMRQILWLALISLIFAANNAMAAGAASAKPMPRAQKGTLEQLRACDAQENKLRQQQQQVDLTIREITATRNQLRAESVNLEQERNQLDPTNEEARLALRAKEEAHNQTLAQLNERASAGMAASEAYNLAAQEYNDGCASMVFRVADRKKLKLQQAAGK